MKWTSRIYKFLIDILYPNRCSVCGCFIPYDKLICQKCLSELPFIEEPYCESCGKHICKCESGIIYDKCFSFVYYDGKGKDGILSLKLNNGVGFAEYFADFAKVALEQKGLLSEIDVITAVPATREKLKERGYNQAYEYAKYISRCCKIKASDKLLIKTDNALKQHELSSAQRRERSFKAYAMNDKAADINGRTILLCDDVITTGSTLNACAKLLKEAGAKRVICVVIANRKYTKENNE